MTEKSEITKLPEGMSSEELDALTTGEEVEKPEILAQEALDATEEVSPPAEESVKDEPKAEETEKEEPVVEEEVVEKVDPKDAVIGDFRRKLRDEELKTARLQGEIKAQESLQTKTSEESKSPLEIAEADYLVQNGTLEGFAMNGALYRQQRDFDNAASAAKVTTEKYEQDKTAMDRSVKTLQANELSTEKMGVGLDFETIVGLGQTYLDKADLLKIEIVSQRDGVNAGVRKAYELCKQAVLDADNADSKLLQNAMNIKGKTQTKPKKEPIDIDALTTGGNENKGETEADTYSEKLTNFIFAP